MIGGRLVRNMVLILLSVLCFTVNSVIGATQAEEGSANHVPVKFYQLPEDKWTSTVRALFVAAVVKEANLYCSESPKECGLTTWKEPVMVVNGTQKVFGFNSSSVIIMTPIVSTRSSLSLKYFILYPEGANLTATATTQYVLNRQVAHVITTNARKQITAASGYAITGIGEDPYGPPPNNVLNVTIIVVACVVLLGVVIITVALHLWDKRKEKRERRELGLVKKSSPSKSKKVAPAEKEEHYSPAAGKEARYMQAPPPQYDPYTSKKASNYFNTDEYEDPDAPPSHLAPLGAADDPVSPKKHKKKKRKKSKRPEEEGESFENPSYRTYYVGSQDNDMNIPATESQPQPLRKQARFGSESDNEGSGNNATNTTNL